MDKEANSYSRQWFEFFHAPIEQNRTSREIEFISTCAPQPEFQRILDVCCGMGRHARALSDCGYSVTAIDRDPTAIANARELGGGPNYLIADIRDFQGERDLFDAVIVMGQSFGHFDASTNRGILYQLRNGIRECGRVILDVWNLEFFETHQDQRDLETTRGVVRETKRVQNGRLFVELSYPDGTEEKFEWQLFSPPEMESFSKPAGLKLIRSCSGFDTGKPPSPADSRIQFVLERANKNPLLT